MFLQNNNSSIQDGGAVRVNGGTFMMNGGMIRQNRGYYGGGVSVLSRSGSASFTMSGGTIQHNVAIVGGGVHFEQSGVNTATFTMNSGAIIMGNNATNNGGGIGIIQVNGNMTINAGSLIIGNKSVDTGGIYRNDALFNISNINISSIQNNINGSGDTKNHNF